MALEFEKSPGEAFIKYVIVIGLALLLFEGWIAFRLLWKAGIFERVLKPFEDYEEEIRSLDSI